MVCRETWRILIIQSCYSGLLAVEGRDDGAFRVAVGNRVVVAGQVVLDTGTRPVSGKFQTSTFLN